MFRRVLGIGITVALVAATGCTMCCSPNDYCGPVYYDGDCGSCDPLARKNSILTGGPVETTATPEPARSQRPENLQSRVLTRTSGQKMRFGDVPGSERIISVTDHAVGPSAGANEPSEVVASPAQRSLPADGWTARRPTSDWTR
jgi:hypothetical protein